MPMGMLGYCTVCGNKIPTINNELNFDDESVCKHGCCDRSCCEEVDGCPDSGKASQAPVARRGPARQGL